MIDAKSLDAFGAGLASHVLAHHSYLLVQLLLLFMQMLVSTHAPVAVVPRMA